MPDATTIHLIRSQYRITIQLLIFRGTNSLVLGMVFHERNLRMNLANNANNKNLVSLEKRLKDAVNSVKSLGGNESNNNSRSVDLYQKELWSMTSKRLRKVLKSSTHTPICQVDIIMMTIPARVINPLPTKPILRKRKYDVWYPIQMVQIVRRKSDHRYACRW